MEAITKKLYEGMFLVDSTKAASDWDKVETNIKNILEKAEAEIVSIRKWDERRLAYDINGQSRGTYILSYFRVDGERVRDIERDVQLSEQIMRVLILSAEGRGKEYIEKDTPTTLAEKNGEEATQAVAEKAEARQEEIEREKGRSQAPASLEAESEQSQEDRPSEPVAQEAGGTEQRDMGETDSEGTPAAKKGGWEPAQMDKENEKEAEREIKNG